MTISEILKAQGLDDKTVQAVLDAMKTNKIFTASEENLDIRYGKLKTQHEGTAQQLTEAQALIEQMKQATKGQEGLQSKVAEYETKIAQMQKELEETKLDAALKFELQANKAIDPDYMIFKLKEKGDLAIDENGKIKGWDDKLAGLKTQFPAQFEANGKKKLIENRLPNDPHEHDDEPTSLEEALKMAYSNNNQQ